jgi:predicted enzyme related to lactoylglutathione lyase
MAAAALATAGLVAACSTAGGGADKSAAATATDARFVWHDLVTHDPAAARRFYGDLLGWQFEEVQALGQTYLVAKLGGRYVGGIAALPPGNTGDVQWLTYLTVSDVDRALEQLEAAGGKRVVKPIDVAVGRVALATDPQGAPIGLARASVSLKDLASRSDDGAFAWTDYFASDPAAAASFYASLAGFEVAQHGSAAVPYLLLKSDQVRAGVLRNPVEGVTPNWLPYVNVSNLEATLQRVSKLGGTVLIPQSSLIRNGTVAVIRDPTGGVLALQTNRG